MCARPLTAWVIIVLSVVLLAGCFPQRAGWRLQHFDDEAPALGARIPQATLHDSTGQAVSLDNYVGDQPLVIQLGSHSCPVYRYRRFAMSELHSKYKNKVQFLLVYSQEAHPVGSKSPYDEGEWVTLWNRIPRVLISQPVSIEQRLQRAAWSTASLDIAYPVLVDAMSNDTWVKLGRASSPAFVVDQQGRVILRQVWLNPKAIEQTLDQLLN